MGNDTHSVIVAPVSVSEPAEEVYVEPKKMPHPEVVRLKKIRSAQQALRTIAQGTGPIANAAKSVRRSLKLDIDDLQTLIDEANDTGLPNSRRITAIEIIGHLLRAHPIAKLANFSSRPGAQGEST